jgi:hypothetical protein
MKSNSSGVSVHSWPVFVVKKTEIPEIFPLSESDNVFKQVYDVHNHFLKKNAPVNEDIIIKQDDNKVDIRVNWDTKFFSKGCKIQEMTVEYGDVILFTSNDGKLHDVSFADKNWEPIREIIPPKNNMRAVVKINQNLFKKPAIYHIVSSENSDQFRLKIRVLPESSDDDSFGEITHGEYDDEYKEKGRAHHVIRIDEDKVNALYKDNIPKTTFAQRRNSKKYQEYTQEKGEESIIQAPKKEEIETSATIDNPELMFEDDDLDKLERLTENLQKHL